MAVPMSTSMDFKEQLQFPIKRIVICIVIHIKYRDMYRLWKKCIVTPLVAHLLRFLGCLVLFVFIQCLVPNELLTRPKHMSSPRFIVGFMLLDLQFYVHVLQIVVCPSVLFHLVIVLSILLRFIYLILITSLWYLQTLLTNSTFLKFNLFKKSSIPEGNCNSSSCSP